MSVALINISSGTVSASERKAGFSDEVLISEMSAFDTIASALTSSGAGDSKKITSAHTFPVAVDPDPANGFHSIKAKRGTVTHDGESKGEEGGGVMEYKPKFMLIGDNAKTCEFIENLLNREVMLLHQSPNCGSTDPLLQYGSKCSPAVVEKVTEKAGTKKDGGLKVYEVTFVTTEKFFYSGTVTKHG